MLPILADIELYPSVIFKELIIFTVRYIFVWRYKSIGIFIAFYKTTMFSMLRICSSSAYRLGENNVQTDYFSLQVQLCLPLGARESDPTVDGK